MLGIIFSRNPFWKCKHSLKAGHGNSDSVCIYWVPTVCKAVWCVIQSLGKISDSLEGGDKGRWQMEKRGKKDNREREWDRKAVSFPTVTLALARLGSICQLCQLLCDLGQVRTNADTTLSCTFFNPWKMRTMTLGCCGNKTIQCVWNI